VAAINVSDAYLCMPDAAGVSYIGMELMNVDAAADGADDDDEPR
jgi:hypothetical protein